MQDCEQIGPEIRFHQDKEIRLDQRDKMTDDRQDIQGKRDDPVYKGSDTIFGQFISRPGRNRKNKIDIESLTNTTDQRQGRGHLADRQGMHPDCFFSGHCRWPVCRQQSPSQSLWDVASIFGTSRNHYGNQWPEQQNKQQLCDIVEKKH